MAGRRVLRFAGISGILFVAGLSPGIFVRRPDVVAPSSSTQEVHRYFSEGPDLFVMGNGMAFILAAFFFL